MKIHLSVLFSLCLFALSPQFASAKDGDKWYQELITDYQAGTHEHFLRSIENDYQTKVKNGQVKTFIDHKKKIQSQISEETLRKEANFDKIISEQFQASCDKLKALIEKHPQEKNSHVGKLITSITRPQPSQEKIDALNWIDNLEQDLKPLDSSQFSQRIYDILLIAYVKQSLMYLQRTSGNGFHSYSALLKVDKFNQLKTLSTMPDAKPEIIAKIRLAEEAFLEKEPVNRDWKVLKTYLKHDKENMTALEQEAEDIIIDHHNQRLEAIEKI
jgi:protein-arginine kinase activator protein McsA